MAAEGSNLTQSLEDYLAGLKTTRDGLTSQEATTRLQTHGNNELSAVAKAKRKRGDNALARLVPYTSRALRDGKVVKVPCETLTIGDVLVLKAGDKVPADCRIIEGEVKVDNSPLTGECVALHRSTENTEENAIEATNSLLMWTYVVEGECRAVVHAVGDNTAFGKIAGLVYVAGEPTDGPQLSKTLVNQLAEECGVVLKSRSVALHQVDTLVVTPALFAHSSGDNEVEGDASDSELKKFKQAAAEMEEMGIEVHLASRNGKEEVELYAERAGLNHTALDAASVSGNELRDARVLYNCTPRQMLSKVRALVSAQKMVAYAGDGVSDAPSLKSVHIGIATVYCSDVTRDASDAIMTKEDPTSLSQAIKLARDNAGSSGCTVM